MTVEEKIEYAKISFGGSFCIVEKHEVTEFIENDELENENYSVSPVFLTATEYESLPEFEGW